MQHLILRCKHCHKEYTYCTYGNGPEFGTEEGCSKEYCAECQKAIDEALAKIPVSCEPKYMEIHDPRIFVIFERVKKDYKELVEKDPVQGLVFETLSMSLYDNTETYIHNGIKYKVEWDDDTPEDKHVFIYAEFNLANKNFTGKPWKENNGIHEFYSHRRCLKLKPSASLIKETPMSEPMGKLFYHAPYNACYTGKRRSAHISERKHEHIKITRNVDITGFDIKLYLETKKFECIPSIDVTNLENILTYDCTLERYDDENKETLIDIKVS